MRDRRNYSIIYDMSEDPSHRGYYYVPRRRMTFSEEEVKHILIAMAFLIISFILMLRGSGIYGIAFVIPIALSVAFTGFLFHELMHKYFAQRYGAWAEFRYSLWGLLLGLITSFFGLLLAAPGAVYISGNLNRRENGIVSLAGPMTNAFFAYLFMFASFAATPFLYVSTATAYIAFLDGWLGVFNMIPIFPLDGSKVLAWDTSNYLMALLVPLLPVAILLLTGRVVI